MRRPRLLRSSREGNKWRFSQADVGFYAEVQDEHFLDRVDRHDIVFGKGDALRVEMETKTTSVAGELRYDRTIIRVLAHIPANEGRQIPLF